MKYISGVCLLAIFCIIQFSLGEVTVKLHKAHGHHEKHDGIHGAKQCGGDGEFNQLRVEGCKNSPCSRKAGGEDLKAELDFTPKEDMDKLRFKLTAFLGGNPFVLHDGIIKKGHVEKGTKYTASITSDTRKARPGQTMNIRSEIINDADKSVKVCVEITIDWTGTPMGLL